MDKNTQIQIQEINRLMNYDRSKTLLEQLEFKPAYGPTWGQATHGKPSDFVKAAEDHAAFIHDYRHEILDIFAIGAFFIPVVGPFISLGFDLGNAALYYSEGDKEMAGLVAALSIIPGGELLRRFPAVKKYGIEFITNALSKTKSGKPITAYEKRAINQFVEESANGALSKSAKKAFRETLEYGIKKKLSTLSLPQKIGLIYNYAMTYPSSKLASILIQVGGITISYFKLAEYFGFTNKPSDEEMIEQITKAWDNDEQMQDDIVHSILELDEDEANEAFKNFFEMPVEVPNNGKLHSSTKVIPDTSEIPQNIIDGVMKKGYLIRKGIHSQESKYPGMVKTIKFIQKLVGAKVDGIFGPETESKLKKWQKYNDIKDDGIVGKKTLTKILQK